MVEIMFLASWQFRWEAKALKEGANVTDYRHYVVITSYSSRDDHYSSLLSLINAAHQPSVLSPCLGSY